MATQIVNNYGDIENFFNKTARGISSEITKKGKKFLNDILISDLYSEKLTSGEAKNPYNNTYALLDCIKGDVRKGARGYISHVYIDANVMLSNAIPMRDAFSGWTTYSSMNGESSREQMHTVLNVLNYGTVQDTRSLVPRRGAYFKEKTLNYIQSLSSQYFTSSNKITSSGKIATYFK